ncbi:hypothetical protein [Photobacterium sanguinicancri]|uniref:Uncharacterized protein n=1 Tax=Photobacterium sanguinicancri TaxID=875932 RepID=A0ABX4FRY3_9GAMM|nr:hypothetical protein [Photobacterium sanguinicancri]OZS41651.1 hypothetical protein ASV53_22575 [Photobacterium sanguinicancri]
MRAKQLGFFPRLQTVLSNKYREEIHNIISTTVKSSELCACMNIYTSFVDVCIRKSDAQYSAYEIRNSANKLTTHLSAFIGFIYTEIEGSYMTPVS